MKPTVSLAKSEFDHETHQLHLTVRTNYGHLSSTMRLTIHERQGTREGLLAVNDWLASQGFPPLPDDEAQVLMSEGEKIRAAFLAKYPLPALPDPVKSND